MQDAVDCLLRTADYQSERSLEEFESLLSSAGYRLERIMPLPHFLNLIEAVRV